MAWCRWASFDMSDALKPLHSTSALSGLPARAESAVSHPRFPPPSSPLTFPPPSLPLASEPRETSGSSPSRGNDGVACKTSPQLSRWARSRRLHKIRRSGSSPPVVSSPNGSRHRVSDVTDAADDDLDSQGFGSDDQPENVIYMVSDGTGWTAEHCVHAALGQFEHCLVDRGCPVNTHLFSQISEVERLVEIVRDAARENAMLIYTLADPALAETAKNACKLYGITYIDLLGPITELLGMHMGVAPLGLPRGAPGRNMALSRKYFKMIEAIEFTIKQDDGALPQNLHKADLVLVGVSRTSKTPLSTYMAQKGYKVANVPLVLGIKPPKELFEIDQTKIYALTINPNFLHSIRIARSNTLGISSSSFYSDLDHIKHELEYSSKLFMENPKWPVIEVTGKAIEETAAVILRIHHDREKKHVMPHISHRY